MTSAGSDSSSVAGCAKCWPAEAQQALKAVTDLPFTCRLIEESHYFVIVRVCPQCAQHYLQVTTEEIDWSAGNDPVHRTFLPLTAEDVAVLYEHQPPDIATLEGIGAGRRTLHYDWPSAGAARTYWGRGVLVGSHD